ncbi:MAG: hypothetical protein ACRDOO_01085 [Actinomadura sp.]
MAGRIVLHIGLQKSGSTYLQRVLQLNGRALADAGIRYPISLDWRRGRRSVVNHEWATYGVLGPEYPWVSEQRAKKERAGWDRLADEVRRWPGTVLLSAEALSVIRAPAVDRFVGLLDTAEVDVVITARDLGRSLPSLWQQHIRNGRRGSFDRFLRTLGEQRDGAPEHVEDEVGAHVWRAFALGRLVRRWGSVVGPARISVVTVPASAPPARLWTRFSQAAGVPRGAADEAPAELDEPVHTGLTAPELEVLASLNAALEEAGWSRGPAARLRADVVEGFMNRDDRGPKPAIPPSWRSRVAEWSKQDVAEIIDAGVAVVGDVSDLRYEPDRSDPPSPSHAELTGCTAAAILAAGTGSGRSLRLRRRVLP